VRRAFGLLVVAFLVVAGCSTKSKTVSSSSSTTTSTSTSSSSSTASGQNGQGVTASTIQLGITYPDLTQLQKTLNINAGDYRVAFTTVINEINAQGGINGRKIVPYIAPVNVIGTAPAAVACTQLTEDDHVFAVVGYFMAADASCYLATHDVPLVGVSLTAAQEQGDKAAWFGTLLSDDHLIPKQLQVFRQEGAFSGHKVAVVGTTADQSVMDGVVLPQLKSLGVDVVQTAIEDSPPGDAAALDQQFGLIAEKFQSAGADVVVAVGNASANWPQALQANHSSYLPRMIATTYLSLAGYTANKGGYDPGAVKDALTSTSEPPATVYWNDPAMKRCVAQIQAAEPNTKISDPITATASTPQTWNAPQAACVDMALFVDIVKAAGPTLNNETFLRGGESLTNITLPGSGGPLHYGPGHHDGDGPMFVYTWDDSTNSFNVATTP